MKKIICVLLFFSLLPSALYASKPSAELSAMDSLVGSRNFRVTIDYVYPQSGFDTSIFNPHGSLIIKGDSVYAGLPFFGMSSMSYYNNDNLGINIASTTTKQETVKKKRYLIYEFTAIDKNSESMHFFLKVYGGGKIILEVSSTYRSHISYSGIIEPLKK